MSEKETLGSLMGKVATTSEASAAAEAFIPKASGDQRGPDLYDGSKDALVEYTQQRVNENRYSPNPIHSETPLGELSPDQQGFLRDENDNLAEANFSTLSGGGTVDNNLGSQFGHETLKSFLKKNAQSTDPIEQTGHGLLLHEGAGSPVPAPGLAPNYSKPNSSSRPIASAVYDTLASVNKYSPSDSSPYLNPTNVEEEGIGPGKGPEGENGGLYSLQTGELGKFNADRVNITVKQLREVTMQMLLEAQSISTGDASSAAGNFGKEGKLSGTDAMALIPHMTQIGGGRIDVTRLRARNAAAMKTFYGDPKITAKGQDDLITVQGFGTVLGVGGDDSPFSLDRSILASSFGTLNSPGEPFGGAFPGGMVMPVIYSMIVVGLFGNWILPTVAKGMKDGDDGIRLSDANAPWDLAMGSNVTKSASLGEAFLQFFGVPRGMGDSFFGSLMGGLMSFYGLGTPITPFSTFGPDLLTSLVNLIMGPGFYIVIVKGILRDIEQITGAFSAFGDLTGVFSFFSAFFGAIEAITSSYTFRFFMIMCQVGRQVLRSLTDEFPDSEYVSYDDQATEAEMSAGHRMSMSRFHNHDTGKVYSPLSLKAHPALLVNQPGLNDVPKWDNETSIASNVGINQMHASDDGGAIGRITQAEVARIEEVINQEYVPFSIHDLRTNEVISLPAFISSVRDDFAANYSTTHGYGRTDPVYAYSKTTRTIGLTFKMVAMNPDDHKYMWVIINKLTAMLYPQRSLGQMRTLGSGPTATHYVQPFSQVPTASPFVRIRLGDVLHSNSWSPTDAETGISKVNQSMKSIFGGDAVLGMPGDTKSEVLSKTITDRLRYIRGYQKANDELLEKKYADFASGKYSGFAVLPRGTVLLVETRGKFATFKLREAITWQFDSSDMKAFAVDKKGRMRPGDTPDSKKSSQKAYSILPGLADVLMDWRGALLVGGRALAWAVHDANADAGGIPNPLEPPPTVNIYCKASAGPTIWNSNAEINEKLSTKIDETHKSTEEINEFLTDKNPIIKAFNSTKGRGLGGVIGQMSLGYDGALWGTSFDQGGVENGLRSPKSVEISLTFNPVHDLPLGLDYSGQIFAPSHPVGLHSAGKMQEFVTDPDPDPEAHWTAEESKIASKVSSVKMTEDSLVDPTKPKSLF